MSHQTLSLQLLATGALVGALGCGTDPDEFGRCDPLLSVAVQTEATLEFARTPDDCDLYTLTVMQWGGTSGSPSLGYRTLIPGTLHIGAYPIGREWASDPRG